MSHRNLPAAIRRPTPRLGTSRDRAPDVHIGWLSWRLAKSPLLPRHPSRVETRSGSSASDPPYPQTSGPGRDQTEVEAGYGSGEEIGKPLLPEAVEASVSTGSPERVASERCPSCSASWDLGQVQFSKHERTSSLYGTLNPPTSSVDPGLAFSHCAAASSCSRRSGLPVIVLASPRCRQTTGAGLRAALDRRQK